jgi:hypothetical protein
MKRDGERGGARERGSQRERELERGGARERDRDAKR